ncbi:MAG: NAD-dependent epimerase/dehydratase family protein, partial [Catenulispora sp.]|nr:NAD-dependent epimerase/dehydratase family protein [Catenulispora sp.]
MDIVLFGATGMIGSRIAAEAAARGHRVTAVSRSGGQPPTVGADTGDVSPAAA